jgi:hypothetical protein
MPTIELPKELQEAVDASGRSPRIVDPRTNTEYLLIPYPDAQAYLDFLDSKDPEQIAFRRAALRTLAKRLAEDE